MNEIGNNQLLSEMRIMAAKARGDAESINLKSDGEGFSGIFKQALDKVNDLQQHSSDLKQRFTLGDPNVSLVDTMVAGQKSSLAFDATLMVRNKLVQAYQDIMNMPI